MTTTLLRFANFLAFNANPTYIAIAAEFERQFGIKTRFEEGQSFDQFINGELGVGYICGLPYGKLSRMPNPPFELIAAPVLQDARYAGNAVYFSDVIVPANSSAQTFSDLAGSSFAYNETVSYSGYHIMDYHLRVNGLDWDHFSTQLHSGAHVNSIAMVASGEADCAAIDSHALDAELLLKPELKDKLRVVEVLGPSPMPPVVMAPALDPTLKTQLRDFYIGLHENPSMRAHLDACSIERYVAVTDDYYDPIRERVDASKLVFTAGCGG